MSIYRNTLWTDTVEMTAFKPLEKDTNTDVLIVGGGLAGVLCAYFLSESGRDYILCEASGIGSGTTAGTTAVVTAQHDVLYSDLVKKHGIKKAKEYLNANLSALQKYRELAGKIDCDFEEKPSFLYSTEDAEKMRREAATLKKLGVDAAFVNNVEVPVKIAGGVRFAGQAQFHPLKFLNGIARGLNIYEHTKIDRIESGIAHSGNIKIRAKNIIVASHFPIIGLKGLFPLKLYQNRSYIIALENAGELGGTYCDNGNNGFYFRTYKDLLLLGGGEHRTGQKGGGYRVLREFASRNYPKARERYAWAAQDCMSLDSIPYIGRYCGSLENVFVATGFNEWGMTTSMNAARILTAMINNENPENSSVFCPGRSMLTAQLFCNIGVTLSNFLLPTTKRCTHLGCALKYNREEHSWDCACHGSRFNNNGEIIDNPALKDANVK